MPGHDYSNIAHKLRSAGLRDETPCAIISRATTSEEQVFSTNVENLRDAPHLPAPTLLVIGEVLRHAGHHFSQQELGLPNWWLPGTPGAALVAPALSTASAALKDKEQEA